MRLFILCLAFIVALVPAQIGCSFEFKKFKKDFGKMYGTKKEHVKRYQQFCKNLKSIQEINSQNLTWWAGVNEFTDLSLEEFHDRVGLDVDGGLTGKEDGLGIRLNYQCPVDWVDDGSGIPDSVDWRTTNNPQGTVAVTSVKDQGSCGSCWAFGGAAAFESALCTSGQKDCTTWTGASEQQLVDCGNKDNSALGPYYDMACNGGWIDNALYYVLQTGYLDNYDDYPYVSGTTKKAGTCVASESISAGNISNCGATAKNSETDLQGAVAQVGAVGVAIDAGGIGFQLYTGGVYTSSTCSSSRLNKAITVVGYGADAQGTPYWTVKNSWGTGWGDNGYILMRRNYNNMCGVAATPAYAIA